MRIKAKPIESSRNHVIVEAARIRDIRPVGGGWRRMLIEGMNLIEAALANSKRCKTEKAFYTRKSGMRSEGLISALAGAGAELFEVSEGAFKKLSDTMSPQGIAALAAVRLSDLDDIPPGGTLIVADGIQDPGNIGTLIRTADAFGAGGVVVLSGTCDPFMPKALRASAGSAFNIPIVFEEAGGLIRWLESKGVPVCVTAADAEKDIFDARLLPPLALVLGSEAHGVSAPLREAAAMSVRIPIEGSAESLNVALAGAVCLYEQLRQKRKAGRNSSKPA